MSERKGTKALELWCKRLVKDCPNVHIENMTTSWRNGIAFCALVHHFRPDLIDLSNLKPEDIYHNNQLAFSIAEKQLGIPALLDPEDMVENDVPDRLSILTYLSQFYQRLGHTVNPKYNVEQESRDAPVSPLRTSSTVSKNFVKADLDKCTVCGESVYIAQRLIVSRKIYHRRCFRCSKCAVQLSPSNFTDIKDHTTICCYSCKNESSKKYLNNNDVQMGMLQFSENLRKNSNSDENVEARVSRQQKTRPLSVLDRISLFEKNCLEESTEEKISTLSLKDVDTTDTVDLSNTKEDTNLMSTDYNAFSNTVLKNSSQIKSEDVIAIDPVDIGTKKSDTPTFIPEIPDNLYKSNINKYNFLQTQLSSENLIDRDSEIQLLENQSNNDEEIVLNTSTSNVVDSTIATVAEDTVNVTDDVRLGDTNITIKENDSLSLDPINSVSDKSFHDDKKINIPPRLKKAKKNKDKKDMKPKEYPGHLNPFSDGEEEEEERNATSSRRVSTNPFGSSDEDEEPAPIAPGPSKRLIAVNPFWSDGEEPTTDEESHDERSSMYSKSSLTTSTPNLPTSTPRRRKPRAPPPPPAIALTEAPDLESYSCSVEDVASLTSVSSYNSTANSDRKTPCKLTPRSRKKKLAPTPPGSVCSRDVTEGGSGVLDRDGTGSPLNDSVGRRTKGPAPGLPLPERREVKLQMSPRELHTQLDLLETQQLGLERQGVLVEQMIRDKCEGDEASSVPQEEVEDLVIQLCELVNEKNDLFRKHTELMYIRRQQRLEQEQADIEHEIRVIQSRPAVNRIDSDKAREEQLVSRLVEIVRLRDALVQQLDAERRRERREDHAIAASIAHKRAQRNSDSNTSSMKSIEEVVPTPKKNKVKDRVKKQLKKAKHTLHIKKKEDKEERSKDKSTEKEHKTKWF